MFAGLLTRSATRVASSTPSFFSGTRTFSSLIAKAATPRVATTGHLLARSSIPNSEHGNSTALVQSRGYAHLIENMEMGIGLEAPSFTADAVVDKQFQTVSLEDYKGKWVVLLFYPLDFTFVCPTEIIAFSDRVQEFRNINTEVIAVSVDSKFSHLAWINQDRKKGGLGAMNIPLVSDLQKSISSDYNVLDNSGVAYRGLFLIDPNGVLRQITINDLPVGRDVDETLRLLQAFQFTDQHGEVCPAGWRPGKDTIDTEKAGEYFEKNN